MLTPDEIRSREFLVSLRGYDRDEVHAFLEQVAAALAEAGAAAPTVAGDETIPPVPITTDPFAEIAEETRSVLQAAHQAGEAIKRKAQEKAEAQLADVQRGVDDVILQREERVAAADDRLSVLTERRRELLVQLLGVAGRVHEVIDEFGTDGSAAGDPEREAVDGASGEAGEHDVAGAALDGGPEPKAAAAAPDDEVAGPAGAGGPTSTANAEPSSARYANADTPDDAAEARRKR